MQVDFFANGQGFGSAASVLLNHNMDPLRMRPFVEDGVPYVSQMILNDKGESECIAIPVFNSNAVLRKDEWIMLDEAVRKSGRERLKIIGDMRGAGLQMVIPNGMATTVLQYQAMSDPGSAIVSMNGLRQGLGDRPLFDINNLPLPIISADFSFSARDIAVSRRNNTPLDLTMVEASTRRVAEEAEKLMLGTSTYNGFAYGGGTIYGLTTFPSRMTATLTHPLASGWTPADTNDEILAMKAQLIAAKHYGMKKLYVSPGWEPYLDKDYSTQYPGITLRDRILRISGISGLEIVDYLESMQMLMVEQSADAARVVVGMDMTTLQWETQGGMEINFKVMAIMVPQLRTDYYGNAGIVHGTATAPTTTTTGG